MQDVEKAFRQLGVVDLQGGRRTEDKRAAVAAVGAVGSVGAVGAVGVGGDVSRPAVMGGDIGAVEGSRNAGAACGSADGAGAWWGCGRGGEASCTEEEGNLVEVVVCGVAK